MSVLNENTLIGASAAGGYDIPNSLRFEDGDSAYLSRTPASAGNRKTWTWSGWVKRGNVDGSKMLFSAGLDASNYISIYLASTTGYVQIFGVVSGSANINLSSNALYRDSSAWYHVTFVVDTTQATASNRFKVYVNGSLITLNQNTVPAQNYDTFVNAVNAHAIGSRADAPNIMFDGYLSEVNFIDGQALTPDSFGETGDYGEWIPKKYVGTYGTNGFYLDFKDSGSLGNDAAGSNNWTPTNLAATDQMLDSPTNNFATLNPLDIASGVTLSEGNTKVSQTNPRGVSGGIAVNSGKWYWEVAVGSDIEMLGIRDVNYPVSSSGTAYETAYGWCYYGNSGQLWNNNSGSSYGDSYISGDMISIAFDADAGTLVFYKNNVSQGTAATGLTSGDFAAVLEDGTSGGTTATINFGQDSSFAGNKTAQGNSDANGIGDFYYAPPTGFLALCTKNLPDATVVPSEHFNTSLWTADGTSRTYALGSFAPDLVWYKSRSNVESHRLLDTVRGDGSTYWKSLYSNTTGAETEDNNVTDISASGITVVAAGNSPSISGRTYAAWNWKANGTSVSNTDGTITSTVSANVDAGFSIVSWTGTGVAATVGHGLSVAPEMVILKARNAVDQWPVYNKYFGNGTNGTAYLNLTQAVTSGYVEYWNNTAPTSTLLSLGVWHNGNTNDYIAYAFHSVDGYSKVGSYTGNGSDDGTFVYLGFRPAYVMIKRTDATGYWAISDNSRPSYNVTDDALYANGSNAESTGQAVDYLSNGFKLRSTDSDTNAPASYIYLAFAESPFKHSTAR